MAGPQCDVFYAVFSSRVRNSTKIDFQMLKCSFTLSACVLNFCGCAACTCRHFCFTGRAWFICWRNSTQIDQTAGAQVAHTPSRASPAGLCSCASFPRLGSCAGGIRRKYPKLRARVWTTKPERRRRGCCCAATSTACVCGGAAGPACAPAARQTRAQTRCTQGPPCSC